MLDVGTFLFSLSARLLPNLPSFVTTVQYGAQPRYRTIMSYRNPLGSEVPCNVPRVNYFSSTDIIYEGEVTGNAENNNAQCLRDTMVRFLKQPASQVSQLGLALAAQRLADFNCLEVSVSVRPAWVVGFLSTPPRPMTAPACRPFSPFFLSQDAVSHFRDPCVDDGTACESRDDCCSDFCLDGVCGEP